LHEKINLSSHGPNNAFLVPDPCTATARNGNSIGADVTNDANENYICIRMMLVLAIFRQFGSWFGLFDIAG
jgi:hypothetical protein